MKTKTATIDKSILNYWWQTVDWVDIGLPSGGAYRKTSKCLQAVNMFRLFAGREADMGKTCAFSLE